MLDDPAWKDEVVFDYLKQSYLLTARWLQGTVKQVEGVDDKTAQKVDFYTRQFVDATGPAGRNDAMTYTWLVVGALLADLKAHPPRIPPTKSTSFEVRGSAMPKSGARTSG